MKDVRVEYFKSSGPGGQHKNRTLSAVRAVHIPTGLTAVGQESRSQSLNREMALSRLAARVSRHFAPRKRRLASRATRSSHERRLASKKKRGVVKKFRAERFRSDE